MLLQPPHRAVQVLLWPVLRDTPQARRAVDAARSTSRHFMADRDFRADLALRLRAERDQMCQKRCRRLHLKRETVSQLCNYISAIQRPLRGAFEASA